MTYILTALCLTSFSFNVKSIINRKKAVCLAKRTLKEQLTQEELKEFRKYKKCEVQKRIKWFVTFTNPESTALGDDHTVLIDSHWNAKILISY